MPLLMPDGPIITATDDHVAEFYCAGEQITRIEKSIDAKTLPPGTGGCGRDRQVRLPPASSIRTCTSTSRFMGTSRSTTTSRRAARRWSRHHHADRDDLAPPRRRTMDAYQTWCRSQGIAAVDFHLPTWPWSARREGPGAVRANVADGVASYKVFLAYRARQPTRHRPVRMMVAGEKNRAAIVTRTARTPTRSRDAGDAPRPARPAGVARTVAPPVVEPTGVHHLCAFAELTGAHVYQVHTFVRRRDPGKRPWPGIAASTSGSSP